MNLLLEEFIIHIPYDMCGPGTGVIRIDYAIDLAREESPTWSSHCVWEAWFIKDDPMFSYCVTKVSLLP